MGVMCEVAWSLFFYRLYGSQIWIYACRLKIKTEVLKPVACMYIVYNFKSTGHCISLTVTILKHIQWTVNDNKRKQILTYQDSSEPVIQFQF